MAVEPVTGLLAIGTDRGAVHLFGSLAASVELAVPGAPYRRIRFLNFAQSVHKLVVVDSRNNLSLIDLSEPTNPKSDSSHQLSKPVNAIVTSPSHAHAFIALNNGQCVAFDIDRGCLSPYVIPNLWAQHEDAKGVFRARSVGTDPILSDILIHPRDLNLLFLAYEGGVVLWDITKREVSRIYELTRTEGSIKALDTHAVTAICIHPSGNVFCAGHMDGTLSFWSMEDTKQPLAVRTLPASNNHDHGQREAVFKLAWSSFPSLEECKSFLSGRAADMVTPVPRLVGSTLDYAGGETVLTVLGGTSSSDPQGVNVLQFSPMHVPATVNPTEQEAETRRAMFIESLNPVGIHLYPSDAPVDDILLLPRTSPHFGSAHDPIAMFLLSRPPAQYAFSAELVAVEFPPPLAFSGSSSHAQSIQSSAPASFNVRYPSLQAHLPLFRLPSYVWTGCDRIRSARVIRMERDVFLPLIRSWIDIGSTDEEDGIGRNRRVPLRAGTAIPALERKDGSSHLSRLDPHHLLVTHHVDLSVRFYDVSQQLLTSSSPLRFEYPQILPHLTINVDRYINEPSLAGVFGAEARICHIQSVHLSNESLECVVALSTGAALVFRFAEAGKKPRAEGMDDLTSLDVSQDIIIPLSDLASWDRDSFQPVCIIDARRGRITQVSSSNVGFHAIAYADGSVVILDMRGTRALFPDDLAGKKKNKKPADPVSILEWSICKVGTGRDSAPHLIAINESGLARAFLLKQSSDNAWSAQIVTKTPIKTSVSHPIASFVIDGDGTDTAPTVSNLSAGDGRNDIGNVPSTAENLWIVCSSKEVRCFIHITGDRMAKAEWNAPIKSVEIISRNGRRALVAFAENREAHVFSVPKLERLHTFKLPEGPKSLGEIHLDGVGDFSEFNFNPSSDFPYPLTISTFFNVRKFHPPLVNFTEPSIAIPPQPVHLAVEGSYTSWIWGPKSFSGYEIDQTVAGPNRPLPKNATPPPVPTSPASTQRVVTQRPSAATRSNSSGAGSDVYSRLTAAINERGDMLGGLENTFSSLESASKDMVGQAKRLAAQNTAKRFFF